MIPAIVIVCLLLLLLYAWGVYPLVLAVAARRAPPVSRPGSEGPGALAGPVTVLLAAYNEEENIERRLQNLVGAGLPGSAGGRPEIRVGIDGATDRTAEIAQRFAQSHPNVRVTVFPDRRGKAAVLKSLAAQNGDQRKNNAEEGNHGLRGWHGSGNHGECQAQRTGSELSDAGTMHERQSPDRPGIFVFTDANTVFRPDALEKLLRRFDDPRVGGVCGRLVLEEGVQCSVFSVQVSGKSDQSPASSIEHPASSSPASAPSDTPVPRHSDTPTPLLRTPEGFYWRLETWLKERESRLDSCLGANGAIYAIRADLFWSDLPDNTIVDDFVIGMKVREQGHRMVYEPEAVAEEAAPGRAHEWGRRVRIGAGDYQALWLCRKCLLPGLGVFSWMFWSHKVLRWFTPHAGLLLALSCLAGLAQGARRPLDLSFIVSSVVLAGLVILLAAALAGRALGRLKGRGPGFFRACDHFLSMQVALLAGFLRFCRGRLKGYWARTPRE